MGKVQKLRFPYVDVHWIDAVSSEGWVNLRDLPKPSVCHTRGFLVHEEETYVVVAGTIGDDDDVGEAFAIPKAMIQEMKTVRRPRKKNAKNSGTAGIPA